MTDAKIDVYQRVSNAIVAQLEAGAGEWRKPWSNTAGGMPATMPLRHTGEPYTGINVLMLWAAQIGGQYRASTWMTFKQALEYGACVRKGERGSLVVFANAITRTETNEVGEDEEKRIPFLKAYTVFNVEQIDGLPERFAPKPADLSPAARHERLAAVEAFVAGTGAAITEGGDRAFYRPATDQIRMPHLDQFETVESYYGTLLHELTHWTKHEQRCARELGGKRFGDHGYALEELVAELGAAFLCARLGIEDQPRADHAQYLASWLTVLKDDKRAIFTMASLAQRAADFLYALQSPAADHVVGASDMIDAGGQIVVPGAAAITSAQLAARRVAQPNHAKVAQLPANEGLFDAAHKQMALF